MRASVNTPNMIQLPANEISHHKFPQKEGV